MNTENKTGDGSGEKKLGGVRRFLNAIFLGGRNRDMINPEIAATIDNINSRIESMAKVRADAKNASRNPRAAADEYLRMMTCGGCNRLQMACFLIDESPWPIAMSTVSGELYYFNGRLNDVLSTENRSSICREGTRLRSLVAPESIEDWDGHWGRLIATGRSATYVTLRASRFNVQVVSATVKLDEHQFVVNFMHDRTEAEELHRLCQETIQNSILVVSVSPVAVAMVDRGMNILASSAPWHMFFGVSAQPGERFDRIADSSGQLRAIAEKVIAGEVIRDKRVSLGIGHDYEVVDVTAFPWEKKGKPYAAIIYLDQVGSRLKVEDELRRNQLMIEALFKFIPKPMTILNPDGTIRDANESFLRHCMISDLRSIVGKLFWNVCQTCCHDPAAKNAIENAVLSMGDSGNRCVETTWHCKNHNVKIQAVFRGFPTDLDKPVEFIVHEETCGLP